MGQIGYHVAPTAATSGRLRRPKPRRRAPLPATRVAARGVIAPIVAGAAPVGRGEGEPNR